MTWKQDWKKQNKVAAPTPRPSHPSICLPPPGQTAGVSASNPTENELVDTDAHEVSCICGIPDNSDELFQLLRTKYGNQPNLTNHIFVNQQEFSRDNILEGWAIHFENL